MALVGSFFFHRQIDLRSYKDMIPSGYKDLLVQEETELAVHVGEAQRKQQDFLSGLLPGLARPTLKESSQEFSSAAPPETALAVPAVGSDSG